MGGECCGSCIRLMTEADLQEIAGLEEQIF